MLLPLSIGFSCRVLQIDVSFLMRKKLATIHLLLALKSASVDCRSNTVVLICMRIMLFYNMICFICNCENPTPTTSLEA